MNGQSLKRMALRVLVVIFVCTGLLGVALPVLPTTPFMILALLCFAKSSERLHAWLYHHRVFGPPLQKWDQHRVIPPLAKAASITAMSVSLLYLSAFSTAPWHTVAAMGAVIVYGAWYVLTKPSRVPEG